jgi:hypothetical protein
MPLPTEPHINALDGTSISVNALVESIITELREFTEAADKIQQALGALSVLRDSILASSVVTTVQTSETTSTSSTNSREGYSSDQ